MRGAGAVLELGEQTGLSVLLDEHVVFTDERVRSGAANPVPKLCSIIAGMLAGADSIDDLDVIRSGGMKRIFTDVYASATLGIFLREFTLGHVRQLGAVLRRHLPALADRTDVLAGIDDIALVDIDSLLRPVYGHGKQGASFGHTKIGSRQVLRLDIPRPQRVKRCVAGKVAWAGRCGCVNLPSPFPAAADGAPGTRHGQGRSSSLALRALHLDHTSPAGVVAPLSGKNPEAGSDPGGSCDGCVVVGPGDGLVIFVVVAQATVEDADKPVTQRPQRLVVGVVPGPVSVVEGAGPG